MLAIANAMEGMILTQAARVVGIERQSLSDAIRRYTRLTTPQARPAAQAHSRSEDELCAAVAVGTDPDVDGISAYTMEDSRRTRLGVPAWRRFELLHATDATEPMGGLTRAIRTRQDTMSFAGCRAPSTSTGCQHDFRTGAYGAPMLRGAVTALGYRLEGPTEGRSRPPKAVTMMMSC